jgi:membrane associated rhomboid family serine protease
LEARVALARLAAERIRAEAERQGDSSTEPDTPAWQMAGTVFGLPCLEGVPALAPPFVTWTLVAVMSLVTWWVMRSPDTQTLVDALGLVPDRPFRMAGLTFVTSFFVHGGVWHLVGNAYFLLVFGAPVEGILGRARYGLLLAAAALCGALAHAALDPRGTVPLVGASAGISGVIAFLVLRFPRARMGFFFWRLRWARDASGGPWIRIPAWVWFAGWLAANALGAVSQRSGCTNVSAIGHLGGVAVGVAAWAWLRRQGEAR